MKNALIYSACFWGALMSQSVGALSLQNGDVPVEITKAEAHTVMEGRWAVSGSLIGARPTGGDTYYIDATVTVDKDAKPGAYKFVVKKFIEASSVTWTVTPEGEVTDLQGASLDGNNIKVTYEVGPGFWIASLGAPEGANLSKTWQGFYFEHTRVGEEYPLFIDPLNRRWSIDPNVVYPGQDITASCTFGVGPAEDCPTECSSNTGMPGYAFSKMRGSLMLSDTPLTYDVPRGLSPDFTLQYNSIDDDPEIREISTNHGPGWDCQGSAYIKGGPVNERKNLAVYYRPGFGEERYDSYVYDDKIQVDGERSPDLSRAVYPPGSRTRAVLTYRFDEATGAEWYIRELPDGSIEIFDHLVVHEGETYMFMTERRDPSGNTLQCEYDTSLSNTARVLKITDSLGQETTLEYGNGSFPLQPTKITDPFGRFASFTYDTSGRLASITDAVNLTSSFIYEGASHVVKSMTTPYGTTQFTILNEGGRRTTEVFLPDGSHERIEYHREIDASLVSSTDSSTEPSDPSVVVANQNLNRLVTFHWDRQAYHKAEEAGHAPGSAGFYQFAVQTNWIDSPEGVRSAPRAIKQPLDSRVWFTYRNVDGVLQSEYVSGLSSILRVVSSARVLPNGETQLTQVDYNERGRPVRTIDPAGRSTNMTYSEDGIDLLSVTQTTGGVNELLMTATYNSAHLPLTITDAAGQVSTITYNGQGQPLTMTDALNQVTTITYDADGYPVTTDLPASGSEDAITYTYLNGQVETMTDTEGYTMSYTFDNLDRPVRMTYPDGTFSETTYDRLSVGSVRDRQGRVSSYEYDVLGQLVKATDAENRILQYIWCRCGDLRSLIDANNNTTTWRRDRQSRVISKRYADGKGDDFTYDEVGRLKTITDALGQTKEFSYSTDNNLLKIDYVNPLQPTPDVEFTYERVYNRLSTMTDGIGTTTYSYHEITGSSNPGAGQVHEIDGPFPDDTLSYQYDVLGRVLNRAVNGDANRQAYVYDILGRIESVQNNLGNFTYDYLNHTGQMTEVNYPNGMKASYNYLPNLEDRRLASIEYETSDQKRISRFAYAYDTIGNITQWSKTLGDRTPITEEFAYDDVDQLKSWNRLLGDQIAQTRNPSPSTTPANFAYDWNYDPAGNRIKEEVTTPATGGTEVQEREWSPNNLNQLTTAKGPGPDLFIQGLLDTSSNVTVNGQSASMSADHKEFQAWVNADSGQDKTRVNLSVTATNPPAEAADAPPTEVSYDVPSGGSGSSPQPLTYDANGNTLNDGVREYLWDGEDRLIKITYTNGSYTTFEYDGSSCCRRITETNSSSVVVEVRTFVWEGMKKVERRAADQTTIIRRYYAHGEERLNEDDAGKYFCTKDHLGSVRELVDESQTIRTQYAYSPWGKQQQIAGDLICDQGYTGHYHHQQSSLYLAPYRAYDPNNARWLNRDPIKENGGINVYGYAMPNPVGYVDMDGLHPDEAWEGGSMKSVGLQLTLTAGFYEYSGGFHVDNSGNAALTLTEGKGFSPSVGVGLFGVYSDNANSLNDLEGPGSSVGMSVSKGFAFLEGNAGFGYQEGQVWPDSRIPHTVRVTCMGGGFALGPAIGASYYCTETSILLLEPKDYNFYEGLFLYYLYR